MLERLIAHYCGPALAGIKPANIVSCDKRRMPHVHTQLECLRTELGDKGICIDILCQCEKRVLVMVYRESVLSAHLKKKEMADFLSGYGYGDLTTAAEYIEILKSRMKHDDFPHEIGVFLGYPLHDIQGFINHRDNGCLLIGEWKVYKDAESAEKLFRRYKVCRAAIVRRLERGHSLSRIFCAA